VNPGKAAAICFAEKHNCAIEISYDRVTGFDLLLWAPDGQAFVSSSARCTADLAGQGFLRDEMDWERTIATIQKAIEAGFVYAEDEESEE